MSKRQIEVVVAKRFVLLGIQDLQQRRRGIAAEIAAQLIDLIEHQHGIVHPGAADTLNNPAGHRSDVSAAMPPQFRFVMHPAQAEALEFPAHGAGDRLSQRCLADSGRADEAQYRGLGAGVQFQHPEMFENPFFDIFQSVVILREDLARARDVDSRLAGFGPGKFEYQFEPRTPYVVVGSLRRKTIQARQFPLGFLANVLGQFSRCEALAQEFHLRLALFTSEFLLNRPQLLPKHVFTLFLADLVLRRGRDLTSDFEDLQLVRQVRMDQVERLGPRFGRKKRMFQVYVEAEYAGQHPGHLQWIVVARDCPRELGGQFHIGMLQHACGEVGNFPVQGLDFRVVRVLIRNRNGLETRGKKFFTGDRFQSNPLHAQHQDFELVSMAARPLDNRFRPRRKQIGRSGYFDGRIPLRNNQNFLLPR